MMRPVPNGRGEKLGDCPASNLSCSGTVSVRVTRLTVTRRSAASASVSWDSGAMCRRGETWEEGVDVNEGEGEWGVVEVGWWVGRSCHSCNSQE